MTELSEYVEHAHAQGLPHEAIVQMLLAEGWPADDISRALVGRGVPKPAAQGAAAAQAAPPALPISAEPTQPTLMQAPAQAAPAAQRPQRPSITPAIAAMHHVFLWFFAGSSAFAISEAVSVLITGSTWIGGLNNFIAVVAITMSVYLAFYWVYLRKALRAPFPSAHPVWTTITICLFGVSSMTAATVLIINLLDGASARTVITSLVILTLYAVLLLNYVAATFLNPTRPLRKIILVSAVPFIALVLVVLFATSVASLGPLKRDESTRENLTTASESVVSYVEEHDRLPRDSADLKLPAEVSYQRKSDVKYELCATFERDTSHELYSYYDDDDDGDREINDEYVYESEFRAPAGKSCFIMVSELLSDEEPLVTD